MLKATLAGLLMVFLLVGSAGAQERPGPADECEACHGPRGVSSEADVPSLAGKSVNYIREMLDQFHYYERHCKATTYRHGDRAKTPMSMCNVANTLSEEEKRVLAEYFAAQTP